MGGNTHVNPTSDEKVDEMDKADKVTETTETEPVTEAPKEEAKVIPISTPISEPVIDELTKPE